MRLLPFILAFGLWFLPGPASAEFRAPNGGLGDWARQIALGRFEIARGATRNEQEVIAVQTNRLKLLAFVYHDVFDGNCEIRGPAKILTQQVDLVKKNLAGQELDRTPGEPVSVTVRSEYVDVFLEGRSFAMNPAAFVFSLGADFGRTLTDVTLVSRDTIRLNGCYSPELDMFERNLAAVVRGEQSLQRRGLVTTELETRCLATDIAGMTGRASTPAAGACSCLARHFWNTLPEEWLAKLEDGFSRQTLLTHAALTPETWHGARACLGS